MLVGVYTKLRITMHRWEHCPTSKLKKHLQSYCFNWKSAWFSQFQKNKGDFCFAEQKYLISITIMSPSIFGLVTKDMDDSRPYSSI